MDWVEEKGLLIVLKQIFVAVYLILSSKVRGIYIYLGLSINNADILFLLN
jgi:hypothetical protein